MPVVTLRRAIAEDGEAIARIWNDGWVDGHLGNVPPALVAVRTPQSFRSRAFERIDDTVVAVVTDAPGAPDEAVAGFVMVVDDEIEQVYVAGDHRGTGVATSLLAEAERLVAAAGHHQAWLAVAPGNTRARRFYERSGWRDEGAFGYAAAVANGTVEVPCRRYVKAVSAERLSGPRDGA
jgi:ribosomal protein S18 acetylase RimI-like enzyme